MQDMQTSKQLLTEMCGFSTIVIGTFLLNATKDWDANAALMPPGRSSPPFNTMRPVHDDIEVQTSTKSAGLGRISSAFAREFLPAGASFERINSTVLGPTNRIATDHCEIPVDIML